MIEGINQGCCEEVEFTQSRLKLFAHHKVRILSGLMIYNYEDLVITWELIGNCLTKEF